MTNNTQQVVSPKRTLNTFKQAILLSFTIIAALLISNLSTAQGFFDSQPDSEFLDVEQAYQVFPGLVEKNDATTVTFNWTAAEGYYLYRHQFKLFVKNASLGYEVPLRLKKGKKKFDEYFQKELEIYYNSTSMTAELPTISPPYEITIQSQGCADAGLCYPPHKHYFRVNSAQELNAIDTPTFEPSAITVIEPVQSDVNDHIASQPDVFVPYIMLLAILGGLILNLMPCVFPVLSLKALSFASHSSDIKNQKAHGWAYTAGAIASFAVIAIVILVAQHAGDQLGWGFQLQNPIFVAFLVYLFFAMGLILSGFVTFAGSWMGIGQSLTAGTGLKSSFFTGVLAAVVASPCSGPFMATALGVAITQPPLVGFVIFCCLGFGMALPFLLLSYNAKLGKLLPAPGAWMDTLKQFFAFPLYATAIWLLWVLGHQINSDAVIFVLIGCLFICLAFWVVKFAPLRPFWKSIHVIHVIAFIAIAFWLAAKAPQLAVDEGYQWQAYSKEQLQQYRLNNQPVFIDLTADWCITCKINERVALNTSTVHNTAQELGIVMMKGDWTNADPAITELLSQYGRNGVPLYLMYPKDSKKGAKVLPQLLTQTIVLNAMKESVR